MFHLCCHFLKRLGISVPLYQQLLTHPMPRLMTLRVYCMASIHLPLESYPWCSLIFFWSAPLPFSPGQLDPSCCEPLVTMHSSWLNFPRTAFLWVCVFFPPIRLRIDVIFNYYLFSSIYFHLQGLEQCPEQSRCSVHDVFWKRWKNAVSSRLSDVRAWRYLASFQLW